MRILKAAAALLLSFAAVLANAASLYNPNLTLVKGNECGIYRNNPGYYPDDFPYNQFTLLVSGFGSDALSTPIGGELGGYTGLYLNGSGSVLGKNPNPSSPPPLAFQLNCTDAGFLVNSAQISPGGPIAEYKVTWAIPSWVQLDPSVHHLVDDSTTGLQKTRVTANAPQIRPWNQPGDPDLILQVSARMPTISVSGAQTYLQYNLEFYVLDTVSGRVFSYIVNIYDNGPGQPEGAYHDGFAPYISTSIPSDGSLYHRFYALSPYSGPRSATPFSDLRFFRIHIGRGHLLDAIRAVNDKYGSHGSAIPGADFSGDPSNYLLIDAGVIEEHSIPGGSSMLVGSSLSNFSVYTANNGAPGLVTATSGNGQVAMLGQIFQYPMGVRVTDEVGNPVPGVQVTFTGPASGASTNPVSFTPLTTTNYNGELYVPLQANNIPGTYTVTASVAGANPASFTLTNNAPPSVSLSTNGTSFFPASTIVLTANAADSDGSISQVNFYANGALIGVATGPRYQVSWSAPAGSYTLQAIAFDNHGGSAASNAVGIVVNPDPSCTSGPVTLDYSGSPLQPNTITGDISAYQGWTITFAFNGAAGSQSSFREMYNSYYWPQPDRMTWSVSKCKGDFSGTGLCYPGTMYQNGGMDTAAYAQNWYCRIDPNTTYYLNLRVDTCSAGSCGFKMQRIN